MKSAVIREAQNSDLRHIRAITSETGRLHLHAYIGQRDKGLMQRGLRCGISTKGAKKSIGVVVIKR